MDWNNAIILGLWWTSVGLQCVLLLRLAVGRLWRAYPRFFGYLAALTIESLALLPILLYKPAMYRRAWVFTRIILLCFEVLAVLEIFHRWSGSFPGIGVFGKSLLIVLLLLATGLSVSTVPIAWSSADWVFAIYVMIVANRAVQTGLAAFLILMLIFFMKFGGPVARNVKRHTWAMTVFVTANALSYFILTSRAYLMGNVLLPGIQATALFYWIFFAFQQGREDTPVTPDSPERFAKADAEHQQMLDFASSAKQPPRRGGVRW